MSSENVELPVSKTARSPRNGCFVAAFVALLLLIPFVRLVWITSQTDTGWETISPQWRDATVGLVCRRTPTDFQPGTRRPSGILASGNATDRRSRAGQRGTRDGGGDPAHSPGPGFVICHCPSARPPAPLRDNKTVSRAVDKSEDQCRETCLAMAAKATELQPKEPRWWRLRAFLALRLSTLSQS